jgi:hypothetical protein
VPLPSQPHLMQDALTLSCCWMSSAVGGVQYSVPRSNLQAATAQEGKVRRGEATQGVSARWCGGSQKKTEGKGRQASTCHLAILAITGFSKRSKQQKHNSGGTAARAGAALVADSSRHLPAGQPLVMIGVEVSQEPATVWRLRRQVAETVHDECGSRHQLPLPDWLHGGRPAKVTGRQARRRCPRTSIM